MTASTTTRREPRGRLARLALVRAMGSITEAGQRARNDLGLAEDDEVVWRLRALWHACEEVLTRLEEVEREVKDQA